MATEEQIRESLDEVLVPGAMRSLVKLNLVRDVAIANGKASITLSSAALSPQTQDWLKAKVGEVVRGLDGIKEAEIGFVEASPKEINAIRNVVAIMSGKGGVGKSLVTSLIALSLARRGYEVGILDADITGPSIPRMFGISGRPTGSESGIIPPLSKAGIEIISINLLLPHEDDAVIWRGPLIGKTITQFWEDVLWGKLDYLLVDLPPGTADAPLTVMQTLPLSGVIIIFTPQELATMVVRKAMQMAQKMNIPIKGVVENMSYFLLPDSGKRIELFGRSKGQEMAKAAGAPLLGQFPIDPELAQLCDEGNIERYDSEELNSFAEAFLKAM
ncbi:MAG: MRP family ATP-binding protein [Dehalococcoidia bacterium]|nr:MAG: MRP family ATP-binding protein [Dehalococcoidia bacterium]